MSTITIVNKANAAKIAVASAIAGLLVITATACGTHNTPPPASPTPSASPTSTIAGTSVNGFATNKELAVDAQDRKFVQTTLSPNDTLLKYDPLIKTTTTAELFTDEEVQEAQKVAAKYYAEQYADSILKGDNITKEDRQLWRERNKDSFQPGFTDDIDEIVETGPPVVADAPVFMNPERTKKGYSLVYGENEVQVLKRDITYKRIIAQEIEGEKYIGFEANMAFQLAVTNKDGERTSENVLASGEVNLYQAKPGVWKIVGVVIHVDSITYGS